MDEFEATWQALYENGSSGKNRDATKRFWDSLTPAQQHLAFENITRKAKEGKFIQYDPIRAIRENIRAHQAVEPVNLNQSARGGVMLNAGTAEIALYKESWGVYSHEDIKRFNLLTKKESLSFENGSGMTRE